MFRPGRRTGYARSGADAAGATPNTPVQWRRLLGYLRPHRTRLAAAMIAGVLSAGLSLVFPAVIRAIIDSVLTLGNVALLDQITLALLGVFLLRSITSLIETYNYQSIGERITLEVRLQVYRHLQTLSLSFFERRRVGELVSRLSSDVTIMRQALSSNIGILLQQLFLLVGAIVVMLALNWRLTLFILALTPVVIGVAMVFGLMMRRSSTIVQDELAAATVIVEEVLQTIRVVKSFTREPYENERYTQAMTKAFHAALRVLRIRSVFGPVVAFLGFGSLALILWYGGREMLEGRLTGGALIAFLIYGLTVATSVGSLANLYSSFQEALGASRRIFELLDEQPTVVEKPDAILLRDVRGRITFDDVSFAYDERTEVLRHINLDIAPGEIVALVGPSGAGKSTLFNLIPRFYDPTSGRVCIDGIDVRDVRQASLREQIGMVPQETLLFGGTVLENIRYGRLDADDDAIIAAAKAANAHEFIEALPDGYDTIVGERGVRLSGGQRQRVAIARAILKDAPILLLDEATSSLDSESERLVQDALARLMQNRTTVIIAHRLSTVRVAHRIAVLDRGEIVELGTHDALMARGGLYAKLYEMQFRDDLLVERKPT